MADGTPIEWTDATWNVIHGCTRVSSGCDHCYIERTPPFRMARRRFDAPGVGGTTGVTLLPDRLLLPLRWRKPRRIFVSALADLFHDAVPDEFIAEVWSVMALAKRHTFQVLTKRHARMRSLLSSERFKVWTWAAQSARAGTCTPNDAWPLPNVWLGVSAENQRWANVRIPALLDTPAAVRWISAEPLLGPIDLHRIGPRGIDSVLEPSRDQDTGDVRRGLDWVVTGGESGPNARPADPDWFRQIRDQCVAAGVAYLHKQNGGRTPKANGRELDGRTWDEYPDGA